ncbi:FTR1 family protein [Humibacter antri]
MVDALPNLLIGLRDGLEAGLVVSILLVALRKLGTVDGERRSSFPIWIGVIAAVTVAASFAAVLTYSTDVLGAVAQSAIGGVLSVVAVSLVTWMVFWMRNAGRGLSGELSERVRTASFVGAGALAVTAFVAIGREGLETTLFIWTAARAFGDTLYPLIGAFVGIAIAVLICALIYRGALKVNLGKFFGRTAIALAVIAAGILAYGLGELQTIGWLPGSTWIGFDISGAVPSDTWWMSIISGVTALQTRMTVLQVVVWVAYVVVMVVLLARRPGSKSAKTAPKPERPTTVADASPSPAAGTALPAAGSAEPRATVLERWLRWAERRTWSVIAGLIVVPALLAAAIIAVLPPKPAAASAVTVSDSACGAGWKAPQSGTQSITVTNNSKRVGEIYLNNGSGGVVAEIETLAPATTAEMTATLNPGSYTFTCYLAGQKAGTSPALQVVGPAAAAPIAAAPVTAGDLIGPNDAYQAYAAAQLDALSAQLQKIQADLAAGDRAAAQVDWLTAQVDWERVGASYNSFGDLGMAVDGLPQQFAEGTNDPHFAGLHKLEYELWHDASFAELQSTNTALIKAVHAVRSDLRSDDLAGDPTNLPLRVHEILEDALRDHLSGQDDLGGGAGYAMTSADVEVTGALLGFVTPLLNTRDPQLVPTATKEIAELRAALAHAHTSSGWVSPQTASTQTRQHIDGALGQLLETLSNVPTLLEIPKHG